MFEAMLDGWAMQQRTRFLQASTRDLLAGPDGHVRPQLTPLLELFDAKSDPYQILGWLHRSDWGSLLGRLTTEHEEITHALLDSFPSHDTPVHYLRQVLVTAGILPARDEYVDSVPPWLDTLLAAHPPHIAALIRPYASWSVLRRARGRSNRRASTPSVRKHARARILIAVRFLTWLDEQQLTLTTATQAHVDAWLDAGTTTHLRLRDFLRWAHSRRLAPALDIPWLGRRDEPCSPAPAPERAPTTAGSRSNSTTSESESAPHATVPCAPWPGDLPAAVLADLLGIHITTAVRWSKLVKRDWASYLAARTDNRYQHPRHAPREAHQRCRRLRRRLCTR